MNIRKQIIGMVLAILLISVIAVPPVLGAESPAMLDEVEVTWTVEAHSQLTWSSESADDDGKVYSRSNGKDAFKLNLQGTTLLTKTGTTGSETIIFNSDPASNQYSRNCQGGGTNTNWNLTNLDRWTVEKGWEF